MKISEEEMELLEEQNLEGMVKVTAGGWVSQIRNRG